MTGPHGLHDAARDLTAEGGVLALLHHLVPVAHRSLKSLGIDAHHARSFGERVRNGHDGTAVVNDLRPLHERGFVGHELVFKRLRNVFLPGLRIHHDVGDVAGLSHRRVGEFAQGGTLVHIAPAVAVDVDGARLLHRVGRARGGRKTMARHRLDALRVHLDEVHVDRVGADRRGHPVAVARFAVKAVEDVVAHLLREHALHCAVAARGENHGLGRQLDGVALRILGAHAHDAASVVTKKLFGARLKHELAAHVEELSLHQV